MTGEHAAGALIFGLLLGALIGFFAGGAGAGAFFKAEAIQRGYASYCPIDGRWAWKGECGE